MNDPVNHPSHYTQHPSGVECIQIVEHMSFLRGNAIKYLWRAGEKGNTKQDLEKAVWYIQREIANLADSSSETGNTTSSGQSTPYVNSNGSRSYCSTCDAKSLAQVERCTSVQCGSYTR